MRIAIVKNETDRNRVASYMPDNYDVQRFTYWGGPGQDEELLLIVGSDVAGWTLNDYVLPRLASGLIFATEIGGVDALT